ncbi:MAG: LamG domain-containing protein, partial [Magnetospirillum sp.]
LIGYWNGADSSGNVIPDHAYNGHDLDLSSANPARMVGPVSKALHFDGSGSVSMGASVVPGAGPITFETWIRTVRPGSDQGVIALGVDALNQGLALFVGSNGKLGVGEASVGGVQGNSIVTDGIWHHVAGVVTSGGGVSLYVDGVYDGSGTLNAYDVSGGVARIGAFYNGAGNFTGDIADVRLWSTARTATEIQNHMTTGLTGGESGLAGNWLLHDATGSSSIISLFGPGGTATGTLTSVDSGMPHMIEPPSSAMHFAGGGGVIVGKAIGQGSGPITYEAWIRTTVGGDQHIFLTDGVTAGAGLWFYVHTDGKLHLSVVGNTEGPSSNAVVADGTWHHVAVSLATGGAYTIYVDGSADVTGSAGAYALDGTVVIGSGGNGVTSFAGDIADARVWDTVRTAADIQNNMDNLLTGSEPGLVGNWHLDAVNGTTVVDSAATPHNGIIPILHHASVSGSPLTSVTTGLPAGEPQNGMHFGGNSSVTSQSALTLASHTVEAWIRTTDGGFWPGIFSTDSPSGSSQWVQMAIYGGKLAVEVGATVSSGKSYLGSTTLNDGQWHNVAYVVDTADNTLKLYVDGVLETITVQFGWDASISTFASTTAVQIGVNQNGAAKFSGDIADVQVWGAALGAAQIQQHMITVPTGTEPGLLANWRLDEASNATTIIDHHAGGPLTPVSNDAPIYDQLVTADYGAPYHGVLAADSPTSATLTWSPVGGTAGAAFTAGLHGSAVINADGSFTYTPTAGWHGVDKIMVQAVGADGFVSTKAIAIEVPSPVEPVGVGAAGGALQFNGSQYAQASDVLLTNQSFSFEFWANRAASSASAQTALYQNGALSVGFVDATNFAFSLGGSTITVASGSLVNTWTHWAGSYDAATHLMSLYENGVPVGTPVAGPSSFTGAVPLYVGSDNASHGFVGQMDEVRLFGDVRSAAEVADDYLRRTTTTDDHLLAEWHMDRVMTTVGGVAHVVDSSASGLDLTMAVGSVPLYINMPGKAVHFNGSGDHVTFTNATLAQAGNALTATTVEGWIHTTSAVNETILSLGDSTATGAGIKIYMNGGQLGFAVQGAGGSSGGTSAVVNDGLWHHVAFTLTSDGTASLYLDGTLAGVTTGVTPLYITNGAGYIGQTVSNTNYFSGDMSDLRVWDYARTQTEIQSYRNIRLTGDEVGLLDNWRLDDAVVSGSVPDTSGNAPGTLTGGTITSIKPKVYDDVITLREDTVARGGLLAIDHDNAAAPLTVTLTQQAAHGTVTLTNGTAGPSYTYTPDTHYYGSDSFVVGIDDGSGNLTYGSIGVSIREIHEAPQLSGTGNFTIAQGGTHGLGYTISDPLGEAGNQQYGVVLTSAHGDITLGHTMGITFGSNSVNGSHSLVFHGTLDRVQA